MQIQKDDIQEVLQQYIQENHELQQIHELQQAAALGDEHDELHIAINTANREHARQELQILHMQSRALPFIVTSHDPLPPFSELCKAERPLFAASARIGEGARVGQCVRLDRSGRLEEGVGVGVGERVGEGAGEGEGEGEGKGEGKGEREGGRERQRDRELWEFV